MTFIALSSDGESGSRGESASNQKDGVFHRFREAVKNSKVSPVSCKFSDGDCCGGFLEGATASLAVFSICPDSVDCRRNLSSRYVQSRFDGSITALD
ncbi:MAG: hypothetical protein KDJ71_07335 [Nitrobacter sp.]|nr:hypothetical protein [Nitrobacter sp.]